MEDSGFDSEEKLSGTIYSTTKNFKNTKDESDDDNNLKSNFEINFRGPNYEKEKSYQISNIRNNAQLNSCKILQRKLELKVERAKKNYTQFQKINMNKSMSSNLIPINRLSIPGYADNQPLVNYKSESEDDVDEISFFPSLKKNKKIKQNQQLSDTFSIQEMTIESDENNINSDDSECSQNLELLPPRRKSLLDKMLHCFYCMNRGSDTEE